MTWRRRPAAGWTGASATGRRRRRAPGLEDPSRDVGGPRDGHIADDGNRQLGRRKAILVETYQAVARHPLDHLQRSLLRPTVRMAVRIEHGQERFDRADGGVVFVLPDGRRDLRFACRQFRCGKRRLHDDLTEEGENRLEVLGQAGAGKRQHVAGDVDSDRDPAAVQILGDVGRGPRSGAPVDRAAQQVHGSGHSRGIPARSRADRQIHRDGRDAARVLGENGGAVQQHRSRRRKTRRGRRVQRHDPAAIGSNQPIVRFVGLRIVRAAEATSSSVTAAMRAGNSATRSAPAIVAK